MAPAEAVDSVHVAHQTVMHSGPRHVVRAGTSVSGKIPHGGDVSQELKVRLGAVHMPFVDVARQCNSNSIVWYIMSPRCSAACTAANHAAPCQMQFAAPQCQPGRTVEETTGAHQAHPTVMLHGLGSAVGIQMSASEKAEIGGDVSPKVNKV